METAESPALLCNSYGHPYKYQTLADWYIYMDSLTTLPGLIQAKHEMQTGYGFYGHIHPFAWGTPEEKAAWKALFNRAKQIGYRWDSTYKKFVLIPPRS